MSILRNVYACTNVLQLEHFSEHKAKNCKSSSSDQIDETWKVETLTAFHEGGYKGRKPLNILRNPTDLAFKSFQAETKGCSGHLMIGHFQCITAAHRHTAF